MKTTFITEDFLLDSKTASTLYHTYAEPLPIIDYHCHLSPKEVAENKQFENITQAWLYGDHYKWRAMRACGVHERLITGDSTDWEKFEAWAGTVPKTLRNPLYHWTHLELKRPFGIADRLLSPATAKGIWEETSEQFSRPEFTTQGLMKQMHVEAVCTTDDPIDSLEYHEQYAHATNGATTMKPAFRPDKSMAVENGPVFLAWMKQLAAAADVDITHYASFMDALRRRHQYFHDHGCRLSDHGLETAYAEDYTAAEIAGIFEKVLAGGALAPLDILKFKSAVLYELGVMDHEKGWVFQLHLGAQRNNNSRMLRVLGPDTGFDTIGDFEVARPLAKFLDRLDTDDRLPKTILYNLNPRDNELMATMIGSFQDGSVAGKIQYGAAWWFLDQKDGITKQIEALSNNGVLSQFVGMLTDSRSFLSYPRHEYFRRLLCNILGGEMEKGLIPNDMDLVGGMVQDICYNNAKRYFSL